MAGEVKVLPRLASCNCQFLPSNYQTLNCTEVSLLVGQSPFMFIVSLYTSEKE